MKSNKAPKKASSTDEDKIISNELKKKFQADLKKQKPNPDLTKTDIERMSGPIGSRTGPKGQS